MARIEMSDLCSSCGHAYGVHSKGSSGPCVSPSGCNCSSFADRPSLEQIKEVTDDLKNLLKELEMR